MKLTRQRETNYRTTHVAGVICGLGAGVWLGAAEAPVKLVNTGLSPFAVSLCMVAGVFSARWTFPTLIKGTRSVFSDLRESKHLIVWAILAGMLWGVANTLTVFAIRDVGLTIAFPLWNTNSLVGLLWGWLLFGELRGASTQNLLKVILGAVGIVFAAVLLGFSTMHGGGGAVSPNAGRGILAAAGASLLWGTMYVPYRKAYISGMNPLSFVTVFTIGELGTVLALVLAFDGGIHSAVFHSPQIKHLLFWLFLGGFVWVIGDLFQQYATKYLGIGRGIPLSNTNQLWGLAWGALVFGELNHSDVRQKIMVLGGSAIMIAGAFAISTATASERERQSTRTASLRECERYQLDFDRVVRASGGEASQTEASSKAWWDYVIIAAAVGVFIYLGVNAKAPSIPINVFWVVVLGFVLLGSLAVCAWRLRGLSHD